MDHQNFSSQELFSDFIDNSEGHTLSEVLQSVLKESFLYNEVCIATAFPYYRCHDR